VRVVAGEPEALVEALHESVYGAEQDRPLADDVGAVLVVQCGAERVRRAEPDRPGQRPLDGPPVVVTVYRDAAVDAGAVDLCALHVEPPHRVAHPLRTDRDDADPFREVGAALAQVTDQEAVRESQRRARPQCGEQQAMFGRIGHVAATGPPVPVQRWRDRPT
jgi:hypothetical protein